MIYYDFQLNNLLNLNIMKKETIGPLIKDELDKILDDNIFYSANYHDTNIRINETKSNRENGVLKGYTNGQIHYEVFFNDKEKKITVEIHFIGDAKELYEKIVALGNLPVEIESRRSKGENESIIGLDKEKYDIEYPEDGLSEETLKNIVKAIAEEIKRQIILLKGLIDRIIKTLSQ